MRYGNFKKCTIYSIADEISALVETDESCEKALTACRFHPCAPQGLISWGFVPVLENGQALVFSCGTGAQRLVFFRFCEEKKSVLGAVFKQELSKAVKAKEMQLCRSLQSQELNALKAAIADKLTAQAFPKHQQTVICINLHAKLCLIGEASAKKLDIIAAHLRKAFSGSFPLEPLRAKAESPEISMAAWLAENTLPACFTLGTSITLCSEYADGLKEVIHASNTDPESADYIQRIKECLFTVNALRFNTNEVSFTLTDALTLKGIAFSDEFKESMNIAVAEQEHSPYWMQGQVLCRVAQDLMRIFAQGQSA